MKKLYKYIVLVIGIIAFCACTDENEFYNVVESGKDVTLRLGIQTQDNKDIVVSRVAADQMIYDLQIYVFDTSTEGKLIGYEKLVSDNGAILPSPGPQRIPVRAKTGNAYIYAVANISQEDTYYLDNQKTIGNTGKTAKGLLNVYERATLNYTSGSIAKIQKITENGDDINVEAELKSSVGNSPLTREIFLNEIQYQRQYGKGGGEKFSPTPQLGKYVMSGYINNGNPVRILENNISAVSDDIPLVENKILLYRILAKSTLYIKSPKSNGKYAFTPKSYRLCNVPTSGMLIPNAYIKSVYGDHDNYLTDHNIEKFTEKNIAVESSFDKIINLQSSTDTKDGIAIEFHYPENLQLAKEGASITKWQDRETNEWDGGVKTFSCASNKASYIEIQGDYIDDANQITANVTYTIHLGNFSQKTGAGDDVAALNAKRMSDFNVVRNHNYIYKVNINGVNDVKAEAIVSNKKDNPYVEGLVIKSTSNAHFEVDAHYEARVMKFTKAAITDLQGTGENYKDYGYVVNISTPFGRTPQIFMVKQDASGNAAIYNVGGSNPIAIVNENGVLSNPGAVFSGEADYEWMRFVRNGAPQVNANGEDQSSPNNILGDIDKYICKYPGDNNRYSSDGKTGGWMNVFQLLAELYNTRDENNVYDSYGVGDDKAVYYTCFIDENYYPKKKWSEYANQQPRTMQIAIDADKLFVSNDKHSTYAEVAYSISQRSISTFYNNVQRNGNDIVTFGTENIDEEFKYNSRLNGYNGNNLYHSDIDVANQVTDDWSAYASAVAENINKSWYEDETVTVNLWEKENSMWGGGEFEEVERERIRNISKIENSQPLYISAPKACMRRNRDTNGDGNIDEDEVKWYLVSIGQYRALFFGQSVLDEDVRLICSDEMNTIRGLNGNDEYRFEARSPYHYWTSSDQRYSGTFWPEEGLTNNPVQSSFLCRAELVRCVRTLESGDPNNEKYGLKEADTYYNYISESRTFDFDAIVVTRTLGSSPLGIHTEVDELNDFSSGFQIASQNLINTTYNGRNYNSSSNVYNNLSIENDPCKNYRNQSGIAEGEEAVDWRMPNQKEMSLMISTNLAEWTSGNYLTSTKYSVDWHFSNQRNKSVFANSAGSINLTQHSGANIRCVRDVRVIKQDAE